MPWKPGQSGNPGGRVGRDKPFTEALIWASKMNCDDTRPGMTKIQQAAVALLNKARDGDVPAWNAAADRVEGRPAQAVQLEVTDTRDSTDAAAQARELLGIAKPVDAEQGGETRH